MLVSTNNSARDVSERVSERAGVKEREREGSLMRESGHLLNFASAFCSHTCTASLSVLLKMLLRHHAPLAWYKFNLSQVQICPLLARRAARKNRAANKFYNGSAINANCHAFCPGGNCCMFDGGAAASGVLGFGDSWVIATRVFAHSESRTRIRNYLLHWAMEKYTFLFATVAATSIHMQILRLRCSPGVSFVNELYEYIGFLCPDLAFSRFLLKLWRKSNC